MDARIGMEQSMEKTNEVDERMKVAKVKRMRMVKRGWGGCEVWRGKRRYYFLFFSNFSFPFFFLSRELIFGSHFI